MKPIVNIARFLVGILFIFSGLVKAIDPSGLSYKMQEFFEVWANDGFMKGLMGWLNEHALAFAISIITVEVVLGFALLIGWKKNITSWLLLLLTLFFTFLTAFVLFTGKIRACGCFGDCIPLTPMQTFTKDLVLLVLIIIILAGKKYIMPLFRREVVSGLLVLLVILATLFLQYYVLQHLPLKDCLPFKTGNNILELRKMPKDAVQDKFVTSFIYEKNGEKKEFTVDKLPDSSWAYVDRKQKLIEKGSNNMPLINDFSFTTASGNDTTEQILSQQGEYYLLFVKDISLFPTTWLEDQRGLVLLSERGKKVYVIAAQRKASEDRYGSLAVGGRKFNIPVFTCDAIAIKTAARNNITLYRMEGPVVKNKWGGKDIEEAWKDR